MGGEVEQEFQLSTGDDDQELPQGEDRELQEEEPVDLVEVEEYEDESVKKSCLYIFLFYPQPVPLPQPFQELTKNQAFSDNHISLKILLHRCFHIKDKVKGL